MAIENETLRHAVQDVEAEDCFRDETVKAARNGLSEAQVLARKLEELKARRLKRLNLELLDEDIMAVERTLKLVKPTPTLT